MGHFQYRALSSGKLLVGTMEAGSVQEVLRELDRSGFVPLSAQPALETSGLSLKERLTPEPGPAEITGFTVDLAMLLKGGVALNEALFILTQMETRRWLVRLIRSLHTELSGGKRFSAVLAAHPRLFPPFYVKMIEVAETSGRLEEALSGIAAERQRADQLRKRIVSRSRLSGFPCRCGDWRSRLRYALHHPTVRGRDHRLSRPDRAIGAVCVRAVGSVPCLFAAVSADTRGASRRLPCRQAGVEGSLDLP